MLSYFEFSFPLRKKKKEELVKPKGKKKKEKEMVLEVNKSTSFYCNVMIMFNMVFELCKLTQLPIQAKLDNWLFEKIKKILILLTM